MKWNYQQHFRFLRTWILLKNRESSQTWIHKEFLGLQLQNSGSGLRMEPLSCWCSLMLEQGPHSKAWGSLWILATQCWVSAWRCVCAISAWCSWPEEGFRSLEPRPVHGCEPVCWCWQLNLGSTRAISILKCCPIIALMYVMLLMILGIK